MSSDDESAPSPEFGASSSKDLAPVTPNASELDDGDDSAKKKVRRYKRPRVKWDRVVSITKQTQRWMMTNDMHKYYKEPEHLWKQARFTSCLGINHVQRIWVCGNKQKNGWPMADLLKFRCISAHSPEDSDVRPK